LTDNPGYDMLLTKEEKKMQNTLTTQLEEVVKLRHKPLTEVIAEAVEIGLSRLYLESVLEQYLNKHISRRRAIQLVGLEAVKVADVQQRITQKDIVWGLGFGNG
jgi:hypothetical protein